MNKIIYYRKDSREQMKTLGVGYYAYNINGVYT